MYFLSLGVKGLKAARRLQGQTSNGTCEKLLQFGGNSFLPIRPGSLHCCSDHSYWGVSPSLLLPHVQPQTRIHVAVQVISAPQRVRPGAVFLGIC